MDNQGFCSGGGGGGKKKCKSGAVGGCKNGSLAGGPTLVSDPGTSLS